MSTPNPSPLKRVASITLLTEPYDLAINGEHFHLVEHREPDAYARPVARRIDPLKWIGEDGHRLQALLDLLGERVARVAELEGELARVHAALQREAEPESRRPVKAARGEAQAGVVGVLEPTGKGSEERETP